MKKWFANKKVKILCIVLGAVLAILAGKFLVTVILQLQQQAEWDAMITEYRADKMEKYVAENEKYADYLVYYNKN